MNNIRETFLDEAFFHDLKSPLSGIIGNLDLFFDAPLESLNEDQKEYLSNIKISAQNLLAIIMDLQTAVEMEKHEARLNKSSFSAEELIGQMDSIKELAKNHDRKLDITVEKDTRLFADKEIIIRILRNIILHNIKQIKKGSGINLNLKKEGNRVLFEIIARGAGSPKELSGVRSYFCELAIEAHGEKIEKESLPEGQGARYYFYLPSRGGSD